MEISKLIIRRKQKSRSDAHQQLKVGKTRERNNGKEKGRYIDKQRSKQSCEWHTERERHHEERAENKVRERMDETQEKREKRYLVASFEFV